MRAKLIGTTYVNRRFTCMAISTYEYRGREYTIEYDRLNIKPAHVYAQDHRSEQNRIDNLIDQENQPKPNIAMKTADQALREFFDELGDI